jgi:hypothetical protein
LEHRLTIIGTAYVDIRAVDTNLRRDIDNAMKKIKDVTINLQADVNLAPVRKKISDLRAELRANPLKFQVEVDDKNVVSSLAEAHALYKDNPLHVEATTDTSQMEEALQAVRDRHRTIDTTVSTHANTARTRAELAELTHRRTVPIATKLEKFGLDGDMRKALNGLKYTMLGAIPAPAIKKSIAGVLGNLEQIAVKAAKVTTIVGSLGAEILTLGANAFSVVGDLGSLASIAAVLPAAFSGLAVSMVGLKIAWGGFFKAFSSNAKTAAKAMKGLPTEAQAAVKSMKGLWGQITKPAQKAFWVEMGTALQDTVHTMLPALKRGFVGVETSLAKMTKGGLASFKQLATSGGLDILFKNIAKGLDNSSRAVKPFFDAMNRLSVTGSKWLPVFGDYIAKAADKFNGFITNADKAGKIDVWIATAVANFKSLGSILGSSGSIIKGLSIIADMSGGKGLNDMANGMKRIANFVNGEPFRSRLVFVLEGARAGAKALGDGFGSLMGVVGKSTIALRHFVTIAGQIAGTFVTNIGKLFDGTGLGDGFTSFMFSVKKAMEDLGPSFANFGHIVGDLQSILGVVLENMVPGLNNLTETLSAVMDKLKDGVIKVIPIFNDFVQNILVVAAPIAIAVAEAIGNILSAFAGLPEILRNAILGFGLLILVLMKVKAMMRDTAQGGISPLRNGLQKIQSAFRDLHFNSLPTLGKIKDAFGYLGAASGYAKDAIGKSFKNIWDSARLTGMYIGDGFKKTFSQLGDLFNTRMKGPLSNFHNMMKAAWKEALMPAEVRQGFKVVGQKLMEVANIYTGYLTRAVDGMKNLGRGIANALPAGLLGPALKALPGEVGRAFGYAGQKVASGIGNMAKIIAGPAVSYAMNTMKDMISTRALYASKRLEDIGQGMRNAVTAIQKAPAAVAGALSRLGSAASTAFSNIKLSAAKAFNGGVLAAAISPMTAPFITGAAAIKGVFDRIADSAKTSFGKMVPPAKIAFANLAVAASIGAGVMADKVAQGAQRAAQMIQDHFGGLKRLGSDLAGVGRALASPFVTAGQDLARVGGNIKTVMGNAFQGVATAAGIAGTKVSSGFGKAVSGLKANFAPAGAAIAETFRSIGGFMQPAVTSVGQLGGAAKGALGSIGSAAGVGLRGAAKGLMSLIGGGMGVAFGAATVAVTLYAQALADSKQRVEGLAGTLDAQGDVTGSTKKMLATNALDGATDKWDNFFRGFIEHSKSTEETLGTLGISTKDYTDKLSDPKGSDAYVKGLHDISHALSQGIPITDEMAAAVGTTKEALKGINGADMDHLAEKAGNAADELKRAQEKVEGIAKATGTSTVQAKILSANFDVLASSTSTAAQKFSALKENLDLVNRSSTTNVNGIKTSITGAKAYGQSLDDTKAAIQGVRDKNDGLVKNLFDVTKGFAFTSQAGRDLHTALSGQSDAILQLGTDAMDKALKGGADVKKAQEAALGAMGPAIASFTQSLHDMGFGKQQIQGILDTLGLVPKKITTALGVDGAAEAQLEIMRTATMAAAYASGNYAGVLSALPDAAKAQIEKATGLADAFARGDYKAILAALDNTKGGKEKALFNLLAVKNGKYEGVLTAKDGTKLGVKLANGTIATLKGKDVILTATDKVTPVAGAARRALDSVKSKTVDILSIFRTQGTPGAPANSQGVPSSIARPKGKVADGAVIKSLTTAASMFSGKFPMGKVFANGGVENHVAQISRGQTPFRVWSEPETGGEAYIPLGKAKRARSMKILEEVAKMFGMSLFKVKGFANGGTTGASGAASSAGSLGSSSSRVPAALLSSISHSLLKDSGGLNAIGQNIVDGIIGGVNNKRGAAVGAMKSLSNQLEDTVRSELDIHSPSKTFLALGKYIVDGLSVGITTNAGTAINHMATLSNRLFIAASDVAKATGRSTVSSVALINNQKKLNAAWTRISPSKYTDQIVDYYQKTGKTGNRTLADIVRARDDVVRRLSGSNAKLKSQQELYNTTVQDVASRIKGEFKLGSNILTDTPTYVPEMKFSDVKTYTTGVLSRLRTFNGKLQALRKKGVAPALINEVANLGSAEGIAMADALLSGSTKDIKGLNSDVAAISGISQAIGVSTADGMYKAGLDATKGLVNGLLKDKNSLTQAANQISSTLIGTVKKNLGIRSPSRVFAQLGRYTTEGYIVGLDQMQPTLDRRMDSIINVTPRRPAVVSKSTETTSVAGTALGATPAAQAVIQVMPSAGMDEVAVGRAAVRELNWQMISR